MDGSEELKNILRGIKNMSTRPEFFFGRGATLTDLNSEMLLKIQEGIRTKFGEKAAKELVKMVQGIKVLSATTFLQELYRLEGCGWKYTELGKESETGIEVPKDENGDYDPIMGMMGVATAMFSNGRDDTNAIKYGFLKKNGVEPEYQRVERGYFY